MSRAWPFLPCLPLTGRLVSNRMLAALKRVLISLHSPMKSRMSTRRIPRTAIFSPAISSPYGFTLVELLTIIALIGILAAIGTPAFKAMIDNSRLRGASQELLSNMQFIRTEAMKRNRNVVVSFAPANCVPTVPSGGGSYAMFIDDGSGASPADAKNNVRDGTELILRTGSMPPGTSLCAETFTGTTTGFLPSGFPIGLNGGQVTLRNIQARSHTLTLTAAGAMSLD